MKKQYIILSAIMIGFSFSCKEPENTIYDVLDDFSTGAILRTIRVNSNEVNTFDRSTFLEIEIEAQDEENGGLVDRVEVYLDFEDNTEENDTTKKAEMLFKTIPASEFTEGEFGFPRTTVRVTFQEAIESLNLLDSEFIAGDAIGGDAIEVRLALFLNDGRSFSLDQRTGSLQGSFFNSPYQYKSTIKCIPLQPVAGTYKIEMIDLSKFGDGWNGAKIELTIDGNTSEFTLEDGRSGEAEFIVPEGTSNLNLEFKKGANNGDKDDEIQLRIIAPNGDIAYRDGPSPKANTPFTIYMCN